VLELPTLLHGCETWEREEEDTSRLSAEMKFMRGKGKYTWQDYKTREYISSELKKINPVVKKIQNYRNKWIKHVRQMDTLNYEIRTMWETKTTTAAQETSRLLMGPEQVKRPNSLQAI
jgi:hypothetical protein